MTTVSSMPADLGLPFFISHLLCMRYTLKSGPQSSSMPVECMATFCQQALSTELANSSCNFWVLVRSAPPICHVSPVGLCQPKAELGTHCVSIRVAMVAVTMPCTALHLSWPSSLLNFWKCQTPCCSHCKTNLMLLLPSPDPFAEYSPSQVHCWILVGPGEGCCDS